MEERNKIIIETIENEKQMLAETMKFQEKLKQDYPDETIKTLSEQEKLRVVNLEMGCQSLISEIEGVIKKLENEVRE